MECESRVKIIGVPRSVCTDVIIYGCFCPQTVTGSKTCGSDMFTSRLSKDRDPSRSKRVNRSGW